MSLLALFISFVLMPNCFLGGFANLVFDLVEIFSLMPWIYGLPVAGS